MASKGKRTAGKAPATREYKSFKFELESADESGEFSGYAAVFGNKDSGGDIIEKGAFSKTIREDFDRIKIFLYSCDKTINMTKIICTRLFYPGF